MSRGGSAGRTRVKTAKGRKVGSTRWLERQLNDPYVKRAKAEGYRSRAAYKLMELDERFGFLKGAKRVIDLGIAPGGWAQVVRTNCPKAHVVGIDLLPVEPLEGVIIAQMDFMADEAPDWLMEALDGPADIVLSDMAANTVGHPQTDHLRTMGLVEAGLDFACQVLRPGGHFVGRGLCPDEVGASGCRNHGAQSRRLAPPSENTLKFSLLARFSGNKAGSCKSCAAFRTLPPAPSR